MDEWQPPRCEHGRIILGCPHDDCVAQSIYLWELDFTIDEYYSRNALPRPHPSQHHHDPDAT